MIPERISVEGFLCYRERQEACFDGRALWMVAGPNGSGKSSLFDAITFALYGLHRGGSGRRFEDLINRHGDGLVVEFDFRIDGALYRARRTLRRGQSMTRQMLQWLPKGDGGRWEEITGTERDEGFRQWVIQHIGLTEETFVSSVLLRQGDADRLLREKPAKRHEYLAEIVGLDRYQQLHDRAKSRHAEARLEAEATTRRLSALAQVTEEQLREAEQSAARASADAAAATDGVHRLTEQLWQARRWQERTAERDRLLQREGQLTAVLHDREHIEAQARQWELLQQHLPVLEECVHLRADIAAAQCELDRLDDQQRELSDRRRRLQAALDRTVAEAAHRRRVVDHIQSLRDEVEREQAELDHALPWLQALRTEHDHLTAAAGRAAQAQATRQTLQEEHRIRAGQVPTAEQLQTAERALRQAEQDLGAAAQRCREAETRWQAFHRLSGQAACPHCGQHLPPEHVQAESARLDRARDDARRACRSAQQQRDATRRQRDALQSLHRDIEQALHRLDTQIQRQQQALDEAHRQQQAAHERSAQARAALPDRFRADAFLPSSEQLADLRRQAERFAEQTRCLTADLDAARDQCARLEEQSATQTAARDDLDRRRDQIERAAIAHHTRQQQAAERLPARHATLPPPWRDWSDEEAARQAVALRQEHAVLAAAEIAARLEALRQAQADRETTLALRADIEWQIDAFPVDARRDPAQVEAECAAARAQQARCEQARGETARQLDQLRHTHAERSDLDRRHRAADRRRHLMGRLVELLGPRGLQRHLVRQAERQIVELANAVLDGLSGGTLHIELRPPADDERPRALDLLARTTAVPEPLDVDYLSGSQKFRVAVALCLAIGQYAGRTRRPIRAVIIDEGFGCLDADNRQVMIQELHTLRHTGLDRILLVSHQDEFTHAFPDGYLCQPTEEGTRLVPFHR